MNKDKIDLLTGACHAILLGMLDPKTILSIHENQDDESSWEPETDRFYREATRSFGNILQQL